MQQYINPMNRMFLNAMLQQKMYQQRIEGEREYKEKAVGEAREYEKGEWTRRFGIEQKAKPLVAWKPTTKEEAVEFEQVKKKPGTAWGWFFNKNPKATIEDISAFSKAIKTGTEPYEVGQIKDFKEGDEYVTKKYLGEGKWEIIGKAPRYKPGVSITNVISQEKFGLQKTATAGTKRTELIQNRHDADFYKANAPLFNEVSKNEVAYWDESKKTLLGLRKGQTTIGKLTPKNIKDGWTPDTVQKFATDNGMTIKEVLREIRAIK